MDEELRKGMREYAWDYFALHAGQRLKTFRFFIIIATVILGGLLAGLKRGVGRPVGVLLGFLLSFLSVVFWRLDARNKKLIKLG